jgi:hypothetical protein
MAKRAKKQRTQEERDQIEADRVAAHEEVKAQDQEIMRNELPEGVTAVELAPTEEGMAIMERALAEATGEPILGSNVTVGEFVEKEQEFPEAVLDAFEKFEGDGEGDAVEVEATDEPKEPNSIVKDKFKTKYIENAKAMGETKKAAKRSNWDWLAQQLAAACLSDKGKIEIGAFTDILDANGVDHSRWTNKNKGWEGRFRMTGRVALQKVVANNGKLLTPGGTEIEAPTEFIAKYKTKA